MSSLLWNVLRDPPLRRFNTSPSDSLQKEGFSIILLHPFDFTFIDHAPLRKAARAGIMIPSPDPSGLRNASLPLNNIMVGQFTNIVLSYPPA